MRLSVLLLSLLLAACAGSRPDATEALRGSTWQITDLAGHAVKPDVTPTLTFTEEGGIAGFGSCNRYFGSLEADGETLSLGPIGATRMACESSIMEQEQRLFSLLERVESMRVVDGELRLAVADEPFPIRLTRSDAAAE